MTEKEYWNRANEHNEIPQVVTDKAQAAFDRIRRSAKEEQSRVTMMPVSRKSSGRTSYRRKVLAASLVVASLLALGAGAAGVIRWNHSTQNVYRLTDEEKTYAEKKGLAASPDLASNSQTSATTGGITVSAVQTLVDERSGYVCFKVSGMEASSEIAPYFDSLSLRIDGEKSDDLVWGGSFYNGWVPTDDGRAVQEDGSPIADGTQAKYLLDDGSYEYQMYFHLPFDAKETLPGKTIHAKFEDFGFYDTEKKLEGTIKQTGTWELSWSLTGTDDIKTTNIPKEKETLGDTGAIVTSAKITPITLSVTYNWPRQTVKNEAKDDSGNIVTFDEIVEPPRLLGVRLKDGRLLQNIGNGGSMGYLTDNENDTTYQVFWQTNRILNPQEVDALLFYKNDPVDDREMTEADFYVIPLQ